MSEGKVGRPSTYSLADKQEAFGLYLNGMSYRAIADELNKRYISSAFFKCLQ